MSRIINNYVAIHKADQESLTTRCELKGCDIGWGLLPVKDLAILRIPDTDDFIEAACHDQDIGGLKETVTKLIYLHLFWKRLPKRYRDASGFTRAYRYKRIPS